MFSVVFILQASFLCFNYCGKIACVLINARFTSAVPSKNLPFGEVATPR